MKVLPTSSPESSLNVCEPRVTVECQDLEPLEKLAKGEQSGKVKKKQQLVTWNGSVSAEVRTGREIRRGDRSPNF